jgi:hypothetical protein
MKQPVAPRRAGLADQCGQLFTVNLPIGGYGIAMARFDRLDVGGPDLGDCGYKVVAGQADTLVK